MEEIFNVIYETLRNNKEIKYLTSIVSYLFKCDSEKSPSVKKVRMWTEPDHHEKLKNQNTGNIFLCLFFFWLLTLIPFSQGCSGCSGFSRCSGCS